VINGVNDMRKQKQQYTTSPESQLVPFVYSLTQSELLTAHILRLHPQEVHKIVNKPHIQREIDGYLVHFESRLRNNWMALLGVLQSTMVINLLDLMRSSNTDTRLQAISIAAELISKYSEHSENIPPEVLQALQPAES